MHVLYFTCLSTSQGRFCHYSTRCLQCRQFDHSSTECHSSGHEQSLSGLSDDNLGGAPTPTHNSRCLSDDNLGGAPTPTHNSRGTNTTINDNLLHFAQLIDHNSWEVAGPNVTWGPPHELEEQCRGSSFPPSSTATPQHTINNHLLTKEIQTP
jgi:hypothetical protein